MNDSVAQATAVKIEHTNTLKTNLKSLRNNIIQGKAELKRAYDKLAEIREFHLLRSQEDRDEQIKKQTEYISKLEDAIENVSNEISNIKQELATN